MKNSLYKALSSRGFRAWCAFSIMLACMCGMTAYAADNPISVINNLSTFMFSVIRAIGLNKCDLCTYCWDGAELSEN